jgi:hypothetical protein
MLTKRILMIRNFTLLFLMVLVAGSFESFAQARKPVLRKKTTVRRTTVPAARLFTVPAGTHFRARINESLSSKTAHIGQTFTANVMEPVYSNTGAILIPEGSVVTGRVDTVTPAAKGGKPGSIDVSFRRLRTPNGTSRVINGMMTDVDADKVKTDNEGTVSASKMKHRKLIFIGGGGAGGAVLGAAIGGGKGALIGGLLGAGGGFLGDRFTKGPEAEVKVGTEFGVYLNQSISLPKFAEVNP